MPVLHGRRLPVLLLPGKFVLFHAVYLTSCDSPVAPVMPTAFAMASAVTAWSPVIITGLMPAPLASFTASTPSSRGGSIIPHIPARMRLPRGLSAQVHFARQVPVGTGHYPKRLRCEAFAYVNNFNAEFVVKLHGFSVNKYVEQNSSIRSGAPFTKAVLPVLFSDLKSIAMYLVLLEKGISEIRSCLSGSFQCRLFWPRLQGRPRWVPLYEPLAFILP